MVKIIGLNETHTHSVVGRAGGGEAVKRGGEGGKDSFHFIVTGILAGTYNPGRMDACGASIFYKMELPQLSRMGNMYQ